MPDLVDREVEAVEPAGVAYRANWDWITASTAARLVAGFHCVTTFPCGSSTATYGLSYGTLVRWKPSGLSAPLNSPGCHGLMYRGSNGAS